MILSLDPSLTATGYCIVGGGGKTVFDYGLIKTNKDNMLCERVFKVATNLDKIIAANDIKTIICEDQYGHLNIDTLKKLSHVRGQIMYLASKNDIEMIMFSPGTLKKQVTGKGNCKKEKVGKTLREEYDLVDNVDIDLVKNDNIADALGLVVAYTQAPEKGRKIN